MFNERKMNRFGLLIRWNRTFEDVTLGVKIFLLGIFYYCFKGYNLNLNGKKKINDEIIFSCSPNEDSNKNADTLRRDNRCFYTLLPKTETCKSPKHFSAFPNTTFISISAVFITVSRACMQEVRDWIPKLNSWLSQHLQILSARHPNLVMTENKTKYFTNLSAGKPHRKMWTCTFSSYFQVITQKSISKN